MNTDRSECAETRRPDRDDSLNFKGIVREGKNGYLARCAGLSTSSLEFSREWAAGSCVEENDKASKE